jgi:hypothetical protein
MIDFKRRALYGVKKVVSAVLGISPPDEEWRLLGYYAVWLL